MQQRTPPSRTQSCALLVFIAAAAAHPQATWYTSTEQAPWTQATVDGQDPASVKPMVTVNAGQQLQNYTFQGFGACFNELGWDALQALPGSAREAVMKMLFAPEGDLRLTYNRVPIGASDYADSWYSLNELPAGETDLAQAHFNVERDERVLLPYIQAAREWMTKGDDPLYLFASAWSPPSWMKLDHVGVQCKDATLNTLNKSAEVQRSYALYLSKFVTAYGEHGIPVTSVMVQNEPFAPGCGYPKCTWSAAEMRDFIKLYFGPQFVKEHGPSSLFPSEVWYGTLNTANHQDVATVCSDVDALRYVKGMAFQWAGGSSIGYAHQNWPDVPLIQSENECGNGLNKWDYALDRIFGLFHDYITQGARAYAYWNPILMGGTPNGGRSHWGWFQNSMISVWNQTYVKADGDCAGNNLLMFNDVTLNECQANCSGTELCRGISYAAYDHSFDPSRMTCVTKTATCSNPSPSPRGDFTFYAKANGTAAVLNPEFYVMKHFSQFVRPGAVLVGIQSKPEGDKYRAIAFDSKGAIVVIVHSLETVKEELSVIVEVAGVATAYIMQVPPRSLGTLVVPK